VRGDKAPQRRWNANVMEKPGRKHSSKRCVEGVSKKKNNG